ncbi:MAG: E3 binding domain-containing protein, partial [Pseudolabrys sp.]
MRGDVYTFVKDKAAGDTVAPGDNLFEIETDKTSMEVPATAAGTLSEIRFQVGETAKVGAVVAVIAGDGAAASAPAASATANQPAGSPPFAPAQAGAQGQSTDARRKELGPRLRGDERGEGRAFAYPHMEPFREVRTPERNYGPARIGGVTVTPLARRLAGERGIDLAAIKGSGPHGRIVARDVEGARPAAPAATSARGPSAAQVKAQFEGVAYEEVPPDAMRATIAARLTQAKQTVPHFYLSADIEIDRLIALRAEANAALG